MATVLFIATTLPATSQAGLAAAIARIGGPFAYSGLKAGRRGRISLTKCSSDAVGHAISDTFDYVLRRAWPSDQQDQIILSLDGEGWRRYTPARYCKIEPEADPHQCWPCDLEVTPSGGGTSVACNKRPVPALAVTCSADGCSFPEYEAAEARRRQAELDKQAAAARAIEERETREAQERARLAELEKQRFLAHARCNVDETQSAGFGAYAAKLVGAPGEDAVAAYNYPGILGRTRLYRAAGAYVTVLFDVARLDPPASIKTAPRLLCVSLLSTTNSTIEYFYVDRANVVRYAPSKFEQVFHRQ